MPSSSSSSIRLPAPSHTRLVTIVAHVDHGKTTLADNLIASNGIISERLAGTLRYLDSDEEEQRRGITMKASAIALRHLYTPPPGQKVQPKQVQHNKQQEQPPQGKKKNKAGEQQQEEMVIHLVDSPGHVDFSSEVTSSLLACDGALLVVDVVEGMCARTHNILREAYANQLVPVLVLNKMDRLCTDLHLSPTEAYLRVRGLIESVNAACAAMITAAATAQEEHDEMESTSASPSTNPNEKQADEEEEDEEASVWNFQPNKGNVLFASALHGWGFTLPSLSRALFRQGLLKPFKPPQIRQVLFGDYRYVSKTGKVVKWKSSNSGGVSVEEEEEQEPLFARFALRPIWNLYEGVSQVALSVGWASGLQSSMDMYTQNTTPNPQTKNQTTSTTQKVTSTSPGMDQVLSSLQTGHTSTPPPPTTTEEMQQLLTKCNATSEEALLRALLLHFRSLSQAALDAVCDVCPSPEEATCSIRTAALALQDWPQSEGYGKPHPNFACVQHAVKTCQLHADANEDGTSDLTPTVAYACKFMNVSRRDISDPSSMLRSGKDGGEDGEGDVLMALVRVLSGTLRSQDVEYHVYGPTYFPPPEEKEPPDTIKKRLKLHLVMGSSVVHVPSISAGHLCAVSNLDDLKLKTLTLSDVDGGMPLRGLEGTVAAGHKKPLVKVNVEAANASETDVLERGLLKLSLADAAVEVTATSKGERLLACQGELHLSRCMVDLQQVFCERPIEVRVSDPIVDFGETTDWFVDDDEGGGGGATTAGGGGGGGGETTMEFTTFFDRKRAPLRQVSLPLYAEEEGLGQAHAGRCRAMVSGRGAALSLRVVPLSKLVYQCLKEQRVVEGSEEVLASLNKAIRCCPNKGAACAAKDVLVALLKEVCSIDENGNCIMESPGVALGHCIKAVLSPSDEVYMPPSNKEVEGAAASNADKGNAHSEDEEDDSKHEEKGPDPREMLYKQVRQLVRDGAKTSTQSPSANTDNFQDAFQDPAADEAALSFWRSEMRGSAVAGFQLAMRAGPFCEEPVRGVLVVLEGVEIAMTPKNKNGSEPEATTSYAPAKPISGGMVVSALRQGIRCALLTRPVRIVEGHLRLTLHSAIDAIGPLYNVLSKRRGKVVSDEMVDGTDLLRIVASLPQSESFGLFQELLDKTSGNVTSPELEFSHFEILQEDPFWIPTSEDEREEYGEIVMNGDASTGVTNNALKILRDVRKRKGLLVDSAKIVVAAEKQRTLARKK